MAYLSMGYCGCRDDVPALTAPDDLLNPNLKLILTPPVWESIRTVDALLTNGDDPPDHHQIAATVIQSMGSLWATHRCASDKHAR